MLFHSTRKQSTLWIPMAFILALLVSLGSITGYAAAAPVKNVIVLVPDGMNSAAVTLARWYKGSPLTMDQMLVGAVKTYCSNSVITDSAPAATAFATGYKSDAGYISVLPSIINVPASAQVNPEDKFRPVATVLEAAKMLGKGTGLVATSNIQHATPACYSAHWPSRKDYFTIGQQQVYEQIDVVLGGGKQYLLPTSMGGTRTDGLDLVSALKNMGYDFVEDTAAMNHSTSKKIWGMFANDAMAYEMDRDPAKEPSLAQMTQKAIQVLSKNPKGFFLFVEGSKVDWAAHANDPVGVISDTLAFDTAVQTALEFAKADGHTLILAFADHNTGGMTIGNTLTNEGYDTLRPDQVIQPLKKATLTGEGLEKVFNADKSNITAVMNQYFGISDLTTEEIDAIKKTKAGSMNYTVGPIISKRSGIGWTTIGHTGEEVFLYAYGPGKPAGLIENTDIAKIIAKDMGVSLADVNQKLFVMAGDTGYEWGVRTLDTKYGVNRPYIILTSGNTVVELIANTNTTYVNGKPHSLRNISLIVNGVPYIPREALTYLK